MKKESMINKLYSIFHKVDNDEETINEIKGYIDSQGKWKMLIGTLCYNIWHSTNKDAILKPKSYWDLERHFLFALYIFLNWDICILSKKYSIPELVSEIDPVVIDVKNRLIETSFFITLGLGSKINEWKFNWEMQARFFKGSEMDRNYLNDDSLLKPVMGNEFSKILIKDLIELLDNKIENMSLMEFLQEGVEILLLFIIDIKEKNTKLYELINDFGINDEKQAAKILKQINVDGKKKVSPGKWLKNVLPSESLPPSLGFGILDKKSIDRKGGVLSATYCFDGSQTPVHRVKIEPKITIFETLWEGEFYGTTSYPDFKKAVMLDFSHRDLSEDKCAQYLAQKTQQLGNIYIEFPQESQGNSTIELFPAGIILDFQLPITGTSKKVESFIKRTKSMGYVSYFQSRKFWYLLLDKEFNLHTEIRTMYEFTIPIAFIVRSAKAFVEAGIIGSGKLSRLIIKESMAAKNTKMQIFAGDGEWLWYAMCFEDSENILRDKWVPLFKQSIKEKTGREIDLFKNIKTMLNDSYKPRKVADVACAICGKKDTPLSFHAIEYYQDESLDLPQYFVPMSSSRGIKRGCFPVCTACVKPCRKCGMPIRNERLEETFNTLKHKYGAEISAGSGLCEHMYISKLMPVLYKRLFQIGRFNKKNCI